MRLFERNGRRYARFEHLDAQPGLVHAYSTKPQDFRLRDSEHGSAAASARATMACDLGLDAEQLRYSCQVHDTEIAVVDATRPAGPVQRVDGLITAARGVALMSFSADCPLVLAYDPVRRVVGMLHASWRCTVAGIGAKVVGLMAARFDCRPGNLLVGIGPSAGPRSYEVKEDVRAAAANALPDHDDLFATRAGRIYFDLWQANQRQFERAGVRSENIEVSGLCTMERTDLFYSHRVEGADTGRFVLLAGMPDG